MSSKVIALIKHFFRLLDTTQDSLIYAFIKHTFLGTVDNKKKNLICGLLTTISFLNMEATYLNAFKVQ